MGSPVSSVFADIVLEGLESSCLQRLDFKPTFFYRYVDDIVTCIPASKLYSMLNIFNSFHPRLQFTYEIENNNSTSFLDIQLIKNNGKLLYNWYRKPTFSARFLNFNSNHQNFQIIGMVYTLEDTTIITCR